MDTPKRPLFKKKRFLIPAAGLALFGVASAFTPSQPEVSAPTVETPVQATPDVSNPSAAEKADQSAISNDTTYTNVSGDTIPSPVHLNSCTGTAVCNDGSCSYSEHRQGTCSHHGGVAEWL